MSESLAGTVALYAAGLALFSLVTALRGRGLERAHTAGALVLGAGALLDAGIALVGVATGGRPAEPVPFTGYLLLSVAVLPVGWAYARGSRRGWDAATVAFTAAALAVICVRLERTWA